jgi:N-acetylglucosamine kinase-like BadF-type ATPase
MSVLGQHPCRLAVGVDIGGTWIRVTAIENGRRGATEAHRAPHLPELATFLRNLWRRRRWKGRVDALVVAARGVWLPDERRAVAAELRGLGRRVRVIADVEAAWHATHGDGGAGILILAGTGSIVLGRTARGRWARAGGLGPLLGDEGSAFWIGRAWLRASADAATQRRFAARPDAVAAIAAVAPRVVARARRGDRLASRVVREAQAALAQQALDVARTLGLRGVVTAGGAGSVMRDRWFAAGVRRELGRNGLAIRWRATTSAPVDAAARLAATLCAGETRRGRA